jgi:lysophospholipase L1-like esterase
MKLPRIAVSLAVLAALLLSTAPAHAEEAAEPVPGPRLMVVGDSISASWRYAEQADADRGKIKAWWAYLGEAIGTEQHPTISAQAGSGMLKRGSRSFEDIADVDATYGGCSGTTFGERLQRVEETAPAVLVVEGGRNDFKICDSQGKSRAATTSETRSAVKRYFSDLKRVTNRLGMAPGNVFVVTPWGTTFVPQRDTVTYYVERYATHQGFTYVPLPVLAKSYTLDGTHPNAKGTKKVASMILAAADVARRVDPSARQSRVKSIKTSCVGFRACGAKYGKVAYASVRTTSVWGQSPTGGGTNFVAYRLKKRGIKQIAGKTANEWRVSARSSKKAVVTGVPTVGSAAWWPTNPVSGSSKGHVGYVIKVYDGSVLVQEELANHHYRVTRYAGSDYPRGFITFKK